MADAISPETLYMQLVSLSYSSQLGRSLKNVLAHVDKELLFEDVRGARRFFRERIPFLEKTGMNYRIKSLDSILLKYDRYYPNFTVERTYNDILGFRLICLDYTVPDELHTAYPDAFRRCSDLRGGKKTDDGYRGVHLYFQVDHFHYPIELQYNTAFDRRFNDWLHTALYKRSAEMVMFGAHLRMLYEQGKIQSEDDFRREFYGLHRGETS